MYPRYCQSKLTSALADTPVVIVAGPRQCGKTTLVKSMQGNNWRYITLDDLTQLENAKRDPVGFIRHLNDKHIIIDEAQRVPELFLAIKQSVDEHRQPGRFLLTGSANAMLLPTLADSLAGRSEVISLLPLSECEIKGIRSTFFDKILSAKPLETSQTRVREQLIQKILTGGFPEALSREDDGRRAVWHTQYINHIIQKDMRDLGQIEHLEVMPRLISAVCQQVGQLVNYTQLAGRIGLPRTTMVRYLKLLEQLFIFEDLPAWHCNESKRIVKTPKAHIVDTGLLSALRRVNLKKMTEDPELLGALVESYVVCELKRLASFYLEPLYFYHYRDKDKVEVDLVIETMSGEVIGIEIKSSATVRRKDFQGLERLRNIVGENFLMGVLLYDGDHTNCYDSQIYSAPIGVIWE